MEFYKLVKVSVLPILNYVDKVSTSVYWAWPSSDQASVQEQYYYHEIVLGMFNFASLLLWDQFTCCTTFFEGDTYALILDCFSFFNLTFGFFGIDFLFKQMISQMLQHNKIGLLLCHSHIELRLKLRFIFRLRLILGLRWSEVEMRLSRSLVEIELRLNWVGTDIS